MFAYDLRLALLSMKRHPGLAALMVLAVALGIAVAEAVLAKGGAPLLPGSCGILARSKLVSEAAQLFSAALRGELELAEPLFFAALGFCGGCCFRSCRRVEAAGVGAVSSRARR